MISRYGRPLFVAALMSAHLFWMGCGSKEDRSEDVPIGENLVENGSFEGWIGDIPIGWKLEEVEGEGEYQNYLGKSTEEKSTGSCSFCMKGSFNTETWRVITQRIPVIPGSKITFSAMMMSQNLKQLRDMSPRANVFIRFLDKDGKRFPNARPYGEYRLKPLRGNNPWTRSAESLRLSNDVHFIEIGMVNTMSGWIYFDDVELIVEEPIPWETEETAYVKYFFLKEKPLSDEAIEKETELVESYAERLGVDIDDKIKYYYYPDEERLKKALVVSQGHQKTYWKFKELHTTDAYEDHTVVHLLLVDYGRPPYYIAEGIVYALNGNIMGGDIHLSAKYQLVQLKIPPLYKTLDTEDMEPGLGDVALAAWSSFCTYLIDKYGMESFMELYKRSDGVKDEGEFNIIFKDIYGEDFPVVDRAWRLYVLRYESVQAGKDSLR